jgi:hypothetical protein
MLKYELDNRSGFEVVHNSAAWRIAVHAYAPEVNGLESFRNWGVHTDSEEGFVLLKGAAWLITSDAPVVDPTDDAKDAADEKIAQAAEKAEGWELCSLEKEKLYLVQKGERHAILLKEGSQVLIMENQDMSRTYSQAISPDILEAVKQKIGGC